MTPLQQAIEACDRVGCDFWEKVGEFAGNGGYVHIEPAMVLLAEEQQGAWFVWLATGKNCLHRFIQLAPYPLPHVVWARELRGRSTPKVYRFERVKRLCESQQRSNHGWQTSKSPDSSSSSASSVRVIGGCDISKP